jgi:hypothetical protein
MGPCVLLLICTQLYAAIDVDALVGEHQQQTQLQPSPALLFPGPYTPHHPGGPSPYTPSAAPHASSRRGTSTPCRVGPPPGEVRR